MLIFKPIGKTVGSIDFPLVQFEQFFKFLDFGFKFLNIGFVLIDYLQQVIFPKFYQLLLILFFFLQVFS